jgi:hypothetical protein
MEKHANTQPPCLNVKAGPRPARLRSEEDDTLFYTAFKVGCIHMPYAGETSRTEDKGESLQGMILMHLQKCRLRTVDIETGREVHGACRVPNSTRVVSTMPRTCGIYQQEAGFSTDFGGGNSHLGGQLCTLETPHNIKRGITLCNKAGHLCCLPSKDWDIKVERDDPG